MAEGRRVHHSEWKRCEVSMSVVDTAATVAPSRLPFKGGRGWSLIKSYGSLRGRGAKAPLPDVSAYGIWRLRML